VLDNFPMRWVGWLMRPLVFPLGVWRRPASDLAGKAIVRAALEPGAFRDRLTRDIFISNDPNDRVGLLEHTLLKVVAHEEADRKLERAIRKGEIGRYHNNDWIAEAEQKSVLTSEEARNLAELRDLVARVIGVDDFAAEEIGSERETNVVPARRADQSDHIAAE